MPATDLIDDVIDVLEQALVLLRRATELDWAVESSGAGGVYLERQQP